MTKDKVKLDVPHLYKSPGIYVDSATVNIIMNQGGVGDMIARIPALHYFAYRNPHMQIKVWCPHYFIELGKLLLQRHGHVSVEPVGQYKFERRVVDMYMTFDVPQHTTLSTNLTKHAFHVLCDKEPEDRYLNYPQLTEPVRSALPEAARNLIGNAPYVVLCTEFTSEVRKMELSELKKLAVGLTERGFTPVLMGKKSYPLDYMKSMNTESSDPNSELAAMKCVVDLREKTPSLISALAVIQRAYCVIGIDNGLHHLAGLTDIPIVAAYTTVNPAHRVIRRQNTDWWRVAIVDQPETLACKYCQSNVTSMVNHIWTDCLYAAHEKMHRKCCYNITAERLLAAFDKVEALEKDPNCAGHWCSTTESSSADLTPVHSDTQ